MQRPSRVLLIVDKHHIGEALRLRSSLPAIRKSFPTAEIVLLAGAAVHSVFEDSPEVNRIVVSRIYDFADPSFRPSRLRKISELFRLLFQVGWGYDLVIVLGWGSTLLDLLGRLVGHRTVGYTNSLRWLLTDPVGRYESSAKLIDQNRLVLQTAGIKVDRDASHPLHNHDDEVAVDDLLASVGMEKSTHVVVFHTGSDWACQQWDRGRWVDLGNRLIRENEIDLCFTGLESEQSYIEEIQSRLQGPTTSFAGRTTLRQLSALLARSLLCVTVDSAISEISQLAGVATVVLAGPTSPEALPGSQSSFVVLNKTAKATARLVGDCQRRFVDGPFAGRNRCHDYSCPLSGLRRITVDDVMLCIRSAGSLPSRSSSGESRQVVVQA
jgi:ADP-heptose:LPS heptosyltransferase